MKHRVLRPVGDQIGVLSTKRLGDETLRANRQRLVEQLRQCPGGNVVPLDQLAIGGRVPRSRSEELVILSRGTTRTSLLGLDDMDCD
ncbi:MAG TPA: hypothetical protein VHL58_07290 [Thermoanaerobaculia bacterium]|nr:hypothetical protein [Thermoanaerobaculia bacterium]